MNNDKTDKNGRLMECNSLLKINNDEQDIGKRIFLIEKKIIEDNWIILLDYYKKLTIIL